MIRSLTYRDAIAYFDTLSQFGEKLDLGRIRRLCALAGHPERQFRSVLVGGTNGKGSTCAMLAAILQSAGHHVGMAPKPHLYSHRERIQIDGELISEERLASLVARVRPWVERVAREPSFGQPTVFEVITLLAFLHFAEERVAWAVVEVGLGGRFDATNVLEPEVAVITNIGLDHTDRLGDTVEKIAFEKAGIIHPGGRVITGAVGGALAVIERAAAERHAALWRFGHEVRLLRAEVTPSGGQFDASVKGRILQGLSIRLLGRHQLPNACLAAAAALWLDEAGVAIPEVAIRCGLERAVHPGRLEVIGRRPLVLLDGAHNADGARALRRALEEIVLPITGGGRLFFVLGVGVTHAVEEIVGTLAPLASVIIATASRHPHAAAPEVVAVAARAQGADVHVSPTAESAIEQALRLARPEDVIVVAGSLFLVAEVPRDAIARAEDAEARSDARAARAP
jgi:dihydrofolate synthase/folylpolyglutamate synthase